MFFKKKKNVVKVPIPHLGELELEVPKGLSVERVEVIDLTNPVPSRCKDSNFPHYDFDEGTELQNQE